MYMIYSEYEKYKLVLNYFYILIALFFSTCRL